MSKKKEIVRHVNFISTEDGEDVIIEIIPESIPFNLRRYVKQLAGYLQIKYKDAKLTRQLRREIEQEVARWVARYRDPGYINWDGKDKFELVKSRFPEHLQGKLKNLADLMNLTFYEYPDTEETRQQMLLFIQEWIEMNSLTARDNIQGIHEEILNAIKEKVGEKPINTPEVRKEVSELIVDLVSKKREALLSERIISQATKDESSGDADAGSEANGTAKQPAQTA